MSKNHSSDALTQYGEYVNEAMSIEDENVFQPEGNDSTVRSRNSILRSSFGRSVSIDQSSNRHVAFENNVTSPSSSGVCYENEVALEDCDSESTTTTHSQLGQEPQPIFIPLTHRQNLSPGRLMYIKKIEETLAEKVFIADIDKSGIFPALMLDQRTVQRNILNKRKPTIFQQVAKFHHKFGIRHLLLVVVLALYALAGGAMFFYMEKDEELQQLESNIKQLEQLTQNLSISIFEISNVTYNETLKESAIFLIHQFYERMLKVEGRYIGSVYHKYGELDRLTWNYPSSVFYAMTLFTTIGYGSIACATSLGKSASVVYSIIGIPLMLVVLSDIGKVLLRGFTFAYNSTRRSIQHFRLGIKRGSSISDIEEAKEDSDTIKSWTSDDDRPFPMYLTVPIIVLYMLFCSTIISVFDQRNDMRAGINFGNAFYFSFISVSTIGLGDVLPNNIEFNPLVALMFLFGLALLSVVNTTVYETLEKKLMDGVQAMEDWLETIHHYRHGREGYQMFKLLGPNIQLLALALPMFNDNEEERIEEMLDPANTKLGRRMFSGPRRTRSMILEDINNFRPTIGILHIGKHAGLNRATTFTGCLSIDNPRENTRRTFSDCYTNTTGTFSIPQRTSRSQSERTGPLNNPGLTRCPPSPIRRVLSERGSTPPNSWRKRRYTDLD